VLITTISITAATSGLVLTIYPIDILGYGEEVYSPDLPGDHRPVIAVIGGGASGTLTAVHLLRLAAAGRGGVRIALIDRLGRHGLGQAYSTTHPAHLLNTPAAKMSAVAGDPGHLLRWARSDGTTGPDGRSPDEFLPRQDYGRYLRETLAGAERAAQPAATVRHITSQVVRISGAAPRHPLRLHLAADGHIDADAAVLATGNLPPAPPCPVPATPRYIADPWAPGALHDACDGSPVVIIGTGLTTMDLAVAVTGASPRTVVHAVSRHGLLPLAHRPGPATAGIGWLPVLSDDSGPVRLGELMWQVRTTVLDRPDHWQDIVDALRPYVPRLWRRLSVADQRAFLRHVARYWEVHRHRMPPDTARRVTALRCAKRLTVQAGRITAISEVPGGLRVRIDQDGTVTELPAGWLINATGPNPDITTARDPLLRDLLGRGLARPDPLRLGIDASPGGAVLDASGRPSSTLFTLGPPLRGLRYETTAIPEIRDQAAALALRLTAAAQAPARPITAA
jgi:uncharacterized NAD(P)/FAD-binding protein YdhS